MPTPFKQWLDRLPSAREKFYVVREGGKWRIRHDGILHGPYLIPGEAMRVAVNKAHFAGRQGGGAQVYEQVQQNEFRLAWTYGLDPYPSQL